MEESSTKAITFAVSIFVTLVIVSLVVASFGKIKEAYTLTKNTDNSIHAGFDNIYLTYDGKSLNGMGLLNTLRKFEDDTEIVSSVEYPGKANIVSLANSAGIRESEQLKTFLDENKRYGAVRYRYENQYNVSVKEINGKTVIQFIAK